MAEIYTKPGSMLNDVVRRGQEAEKLKKIDEEVKRGKGFPFQEYIYRLREAEKRKRRGKERARHTVQIYDTNNYRFEGSPRKLTTEHDPKNVYSWAFTGEEKPNQVAEQYWNRSQQARRAAASKIGMRGIPNNVVVPVIPYKWPHAPKFGVNPSPDLPNVNDIVANVYGRPILEVPSFDEAVGPNYADFAGDIPSAMVPHPTRSAKYSGFAFTGDMTNWLQQALINKLQEEATDPKEKRDRDRAITDITQMYIESMANPQIARIHELYGHGSTPMLLDSIPTLTDRTPRAAYDTMTKLRSTLNNIRGIHGVKTGEALGAMHMIKGFWGRRHPNEPLSDDWNEAVNQFKSQGYLDTDGTFTDKLFEGTGYTPHVSTINSLMELYNRQKELLSDEQQQTFDEQLNWYWPQANNRVKSGSEMTKHA